jgi:hypothetical protein
MRKRVSLVMSLLFLAAPLAMAQEWPQWALNAQHTSKVSTVGQNLNQNIVNLIYDPLVPQEMAESAKLFGDADLLAHFQAPLVDGNNVYMVFKSGSYNPRNYSSQSWGETKYAWNGSHTALNIVWQFSSDYNAPGSLLDDWEPVFHPALANGSLYVPGKGGSVFRVNKSTGVGTRINPFPTDDGGIRGNLDMTSPITVDGSGNIYYTAVQFTNDVDIFHDDIVGAWLVKITPADAITALPWSTVAAGTPATTDLCQNAFSANADGTIVNGPWPPSPTAVPNSIPCSTQRPAFNAAPAVASNGTIYVISRAHLLSREGWLIALNANLTQKWRASLRARFKDGCGVPVSLGGTLPPNGAPGGCRIGSLYGVDPATNTMGGGRVLDDGSSSPVIAADGSVYYGAYTRYNYAQGHMMHFDSNGNFLGHYNFGWDITPAVYNGSIITKDNHYGEVGSYCNDPAFCPDDVSGRAYPEAYFISQVSPTLRSDALTDRGDKIMTQQWTYQSVQHDSCSRDANGNVTCEPGTNPNGFEWCVNAFVVDGQGNAYANSEDGWLYKIQQGGTVTVAPGCGTTTFNCGGKIFQQLALGAAYTPTSIDSAGRIYSQNAGHLFVAGN